MFLNKIPSYKKLSSLIQLQFPLERFIEYVFVTWTEKGLIAFYDSKRKIGEFTGPMNSMEELFCIMNSVSSTMVHIPCFQEVKFT